MSDAPLIFPCPDVPDHYPLPEPKLQAVARRLPILATQTEDFLL